MHIIVIPWINANTLPGWWSAEYVIAGGGSDWVMLILFYPVGTY